MAGAIRRFPFLADAEAIRLVCHPDAMTPDANPLLGPLPGVRGLLDRRGAVAQRLRRGRRDRPGDGRLDHGRRSRASTSDRTGPGGSPTRTATRRSRPGSPARPTRDYYRLRYPYDADLAGRPRRLSALHGRLQEAGAVFGTKAGWERADLPRARARRGAGRAGDQAATAGQQPRLVRSGRRGARAVRERAGIIDLSSFGKIDVAGPGALGAAPGRLRQRRRPAGREPSSTAVLRRARRDRRRRDGHAAGRGPLPGRDRRRLPGRRTSPGSGPTARESDRAVDDPRCQRRVGRHRPVGPAGARHPRGGHGVTTSRTRRCPPRQPGRSPSGRPRPRPRGPDQLCRRTGLGADDARRTGRWRSGTRCHGGRGLDAGLEPFGLPRPRRPPDGEGVSLLRDGPDDPGDAVRGRARRRSSGSARATFIGRDGARRRARSRAGRSERAGCGRS